jgi:hypothetical protein
MPALVAAGEAVIVAEPGAHHYRLVGLELRPAPGKFLYNLVVLDPRRGDPASFPHHIVIDRCWLHGDPDAGGRRGVALNSRHTAIVGSHLSDFKEAGADSQAVAGWTGPGPFALLDNYLEAAGENVMFGGTDPLFEDLVPSDIEIRRNDLVKPRALAAQPERWTVKNLLELKNARRVLIAGNVLRNSWADDQAGFAILLTVRNQDGGAPWSVVEDVTLVDNVVRDVDSGINLLARDDSGQPSRLARRILVRNNLFLGVGSAQNPGRLFQLLGGAADVVIEHNTALHSGTILTAEGDPHARFVFRDNIVFHDGIGMAGSGTAPGQATLDRYFPGSDVRGNLIVGGGSARYPAGNRFPASARALRFTGERTFRLAADSPYKAAGTDGGDPGVEIEALRAALGGRGLD